MIKVVTHNSGFHADDVFAVATLQLHFGVAELDVIRTRDEAVIATGDWVVDVGGIYNPAQKRFDHHQNGAPIRENGIPYAAFGLVWKELGVSVAGSPEVASSVERTLVMPIDANDNGISLCHMTEYEIRPLTLSDMVALQCPLRGSGEDLDEAFLKTVAIARDIITRCIVHATAKEQMRSLVAEAYATKEDKHALVFDQPISRSLLIEYPDVQFLVCPDDPATNTNWIAVAIAKTKDTFETRMPFPSAWAGLRDQELATVSGISDAIFCHRNRFLFVAKSKEGAFRAVEMTRAQAE